ncbi:hypothetical protein DY023_15530 [Microbacterium bovistercoris]|uniref:Uncharacterized protein n=1 Tax=Microbacterium bovistercoris TaxID=2293570 RepID=A0A371NQ84_9MICO|nr:hypothetical protein [Microbacterium bovistercoris]REJ04310.1 hypothetical protein DY023_15530 [Microbacterium bovistercoris]
MNLRILLRTWIVCLFALLPLLALLLVPQLMRSRAGSEQLLFLGTGLLLVLLTVAFVAAPVPSSVAAPEAGVWDRRTSMRTAAAVWRKRPGRASGALLAGIAVYALGQTVGYGVGVIVPYIEDNPAHLSDPTQSPWILHYPAYALQAVVLYLITAFAVAVYAALLRAAAPATALSAAASAP